VSDLPLLVAAHHRLGDLGASRRRRKQETVVAAEQAEKARVVDHLIAGDDSNMQVMSMLCGEDSRGASVDETAPPGADPGLLAGPFAQIVVDEAKELTDAKWQMLLRRCPFRSITLVGTAHRPGTGSRSRGRGGSSGSGSSGTTWLPWASAIGR
jgi:hypothetical protein